jgi:hypothetical protein
MTIYLLLFLGRVDGDAVLGGVLDAAVVIQLVGVETGGGELDVTMIDVHAREDVLGRTVAEVEHGQEGVLPVLVAPRVLRYARRR